MHPPKSSMLLLSDQDVYQTTVEFLRARGHDVVTAADLGLSTALDPELLRQATAMGRLFLTRDKGYGALVFLEEEDHAGVLLLRGSPDSMPAVHLQLGRLLDEQPVERLRNCLGAITPNGYRLRRSRASQ